MLGQPFEPGVDGAALHVAEQPRVLEGIGPVQPLDAVHDPGHVAHAGDDFGLGEQVQQRRQLGAPLAVGIEDHPVIGLVFIKGREQAAQHRPPLLDADHRAEFAAGAHLRQGASEQRADRAGHAGMEAGVLPQQRGEQGGTGPGESGNKVIVFHNRAGRFGRKAVRRSPDAGEAAGSSTGTGRGKCRLRRHHFGDVSER